MIHDPYEFEVGQKVEHIYRDVKELRKVHPTHLVPRYNKLYDSVRSEQAWRYCADGMAHGTILPVAGTATLTNVVLLNDPVWRLARWPGGVHLYLVVRQFGIAPQAAPATVGNMELVFFDVNGIPIPLGNFLSSQAGNVQYDSLEPVPLTDPDATLVGQLSILLQPGGASPVTYNWSMGFSAAYSLPSRHGYDLMPEEAWKHE